MKRLDKERWMQKTAEVKIIEKHAQIGMTGGEVQRVDIANGITNSMGAIIG